jgi:hypothetical protein
MDTKSLNKGAIPFQLMTNFIKNLKFKKNNLFININ